MGLADAALFPTLTFCRFMLGPVFGWKPIFDSRPALGRYWAAMEGDADAARVRATSCSMQHPLDCISSMYIAAGAEPCHNLTAQVIKEIEGALDEWKEMGRWESRGILQQVAEKEYQWSY